MNLSRRIAPKPQAARLMSFLRVFDKLQDFPETGYLWEPDTDYRELPLRFGAKGYVVRYRLLENQIIIVRIWHSLENR